MIRNKNLLMLTIFWVLPTIHFILQPSYSIIPWPTWLALFLTMFLCIKDRRLIAYSIPFIALLSPLAANGRFMTMLPSELFIILISFYALFSFTIQRKHTINLKPGDPYLLCLIPVIFISYLLSFEIYVLSKSIVSWILIVAVFMITRAHIKSSQDVNNFLLMLVVASLLNALIIFSAFKAKVNLSDFMLDTNLLSKTKFNSEGLSFFYRASNFYTGILFVFGPAVVISAIKAFNSKNMKSKLLFLFLGTLFLINLLLMNEKTGLVSLVLTFSLLPLFYIFLPRKGVNNFKIGKYLIVSLILLLGFLIYNQFSQIPLYKIGLGSFDERLCVYGNTFNTLLDNPSHILFGFGPDSSNLLQNEYTDSAQNCMGSIKGAIDSGWMTFLFEYGLSFVSLYVLFNAVSFFHLFKMAKNRTNMRTIYITLIGMLLFINFAALTDVLGTSKTTWIIAQIISLVGVVLSRDWLASDQS